MVKMVKMCECWHTCLLPKINECSALATELDNRCNDYPTKPKDYKVKLNINEKDVISYFGQMPVYPHVDGNIFVKEEDTE